MVRVVMAPLAILGCSSKGPNVEESNRFVSVLLCKSITFAPIIFVNFVNHWFEMLGW